MRRKFEDWLARLQSRYVARASGYVSVGWSWWRGELLELLPDAVRESIENAQHKTYLQISGTEVIAFLGAPDRMQETGRCELNADSATAKSILAGNNDVVLLLPENATLRKSITLPAAAEDNLREVLAFGMDEQTPFSAEQVYYDYKVTGRSSQHRQLHVELLVAPRRSMDALLESLQSTGLQPDVVSTKSSANTVFDVNLLPKEQRPTRHRTTQRLNIGLAALLVVLTAAAIITPVQQKKQALAALEQTVAAAMEASEESAKLRREIEQMTNASTRLVEMKAARPMTTRILDELTRITPDDTWLNRVDIRGNEIQIQGESSTAATLIGLIGGSVLFKNPQFRSPVTKVPRTERERFHLSADLDETEIR